jgi:tRNA-specific 2-thiouridylase
MIDSKAPVLVALSGGVDSAVVLNLIKSRYRNVTGVSHHHWPESRCCSTECMDNCSRQCRDLGLPFSVVDTMVEFTEEIIQPFVQAYRKGTTPNPCVFCNQKNRFGHMIDKFFQNKGLQVPKNYRIATGHYARISSEKNRYRLRRGIDKKKDQSYMLYRLSQEQLSHCLFPLGDYKKSEIRKMAESWSLLSAKKQDSQDICFVEKDYRDFIQQYTGEKDTKGYFLDKKGKKLGTHNGISSYNRGQRKGLGLSGGPWFVLDILPESNTVILGSRKELYITQFSISDCVWHLPEVPEIFSCSVQVRYHGPIYKCTVKKTGNDRFQIELEQASDEISPGQSAVFYSGDTVWGGGIIVK